MCEADAGVACGALDDGSAGLESVRDRSATRSERTTGLWGAWYSQTSLLRIEDDAERSAVLDATAGVLQLALRDDVAPRLP